RWPHRAALSRAWATRPRPGKRSRAGEYNEGPAPAGSSLCPRSRMPRLAAQYPLPCFDETPVSPRHGRVEMPVPAEELERLVAEMVARAQAEVPVDAGLEMLAAVTALRRALLAVEARAISAARADGYHWASIGAALGLSGQGAGKRARQLHQLVDPALNPTTGRPHRRGHYRRRRRRNP